MTMATMAFDAAMSCINHHQQFTMSNCPHLDNATGYDLSSSTCDSRPFDSGRIYGNSADTDNFHNAAFTDFESQDIGSLLQDLNHPDFMTILDDWSCLGDYTPSQYAVNSGASCGQVSRSVNETDVGVVKTETTDVIVVAPDLDENGNYWDYEELRTTRIGDGSLVFSTRDQVESTRTAWFSPSSAWTYHGVDSWRSSSDLTPFSISKIERPDVQVQRIQYDARPKGGSGSGSGIYLSSPENSLSSRPSSADVSFDQDFCEFANISSNSPAIVASSNTVVQATVNSKHRTRGPSTGSRRRRSVCLWEFLRELLYSQQCSANKPPIRWLDRDRGIFKIEDSTLVAKMWGQRKNRPAMNYDKLSRSIRQYYKHGIIQKTTKSRRLVFQFCPQYI